MSDIELEVEYFTKMFGDRYAKLIRNSLTWLEGNEHFWELNRPINKKEFLKNLIDRVAG